jgi:hypothetical protein
MGTAHPNLTTGRTGRASAHLRPLDSLIQALDEAHCLWCRLLLRVLKRHAEHAGGVPGYYPKGVAR